MTASRVESPGGSGNWAMPSPGGPLLTGRADFRHLSLLAGYQSLLRLSTLHVSVMQCHEIPLIETEQLMHAAAANLQTATGSRDSGC